MNWRMQTDYHGPNSIRAHLFTADGPLCSQRMGETEPASADCKRCTKCVALIPRAEAWERERKYREGAKAS